MKPKRIVRKKEAWVRLGCGHSKFYTDYLFRSPDDPFVPGTKIPRLKLIPLGSRNVGFLDQEIDALIDALAKLRDPAPVGTRTTRTSERPALRR